MNRNRSAPRIWDTDWLVLSALARALDAQLARHVRPATRLVDMGCGDKPYEAMIRARGIDYVGVDLDGDAVVRLNPDGTAPLPDRDAGAVLSVQVLEHVRDVRGYCAELRRLLRDDGVLLLSTHGTWLYHPHPEDHRRWTRPGLASELAGCGFSVRETVAIAGPLATSTIIRLTGFAYALRKLPLIGPALTMALATVMNLRALIEDRITPAAIRDDNACVYLVRAVKTPA